MNNKHNFFNKLFWGLMFLVGAALLIAEKLGYYQNLKNISLTGILITLFFVWMTVQGITTRNFFLILFGIALIAIQYDEFLHIEAITPWTLLGSTLLASIGLTILFPTKNSNNTIGKHSFIDKGKKVFNDVDGEVILLKNSFGESVKYINTNAFVNAQIENSFGALKVFFDNAIIKNGVADVNISTSFGETTLYIPKTWNVEDHIKSSLASVKSEGIQETQGSPTLRLYGSVSFGEITVVFV